MDESDEFIEMCKTLPKNIEHDFENILGSVYDIGSVCVLDDGEIGYIGTHLGGWQYHGYDCSGYNTPVIRLYTQDQLQDILAHHVGCTYSTPGFLIGMAGCLDTFIDINIEYICRTNFTSIEQLWLAFIVYEKYELEWNTDRKEWI